MKMLSRLKELIVGKVRAPEHPELDERERHIDQTLANAYGRTRDDIERDIRRRALRIEVESMRRR